ncbi:MAG: flagellar M-ring protein FliF, partial [Alphaproteobacteria bacterium]|nr:flagellar M-ring protein FliF [Alphaproteobacteria bacterium]
MNTFIDTFKNLGVGRLAAAAGMTIGLIVFFVFLATRLSTSQLALLFDNLKPEDSTRIVHELESMGIPFEVSSNDQQIRVPSDQVARLRLTFAEQGLPEAGSIGYEIFDRDQTLGTSNFIQNINHLRALEGELARTIATISSVKAARVHLVMPRREVFSRQRLDPSASIILKMRGSARLDHNQIQGVQHLVATAVAGLKPDRISIVDDRGTLLSRGDARDDESLAALNAEERRIAFETRMNRTLEQLLEPSVGLGNVRTEVRVDMDFDRIVTNEEIFDPDGQVVRSTQTIEEANQNTEPDAGAVTVGQNLPDAQAADAQGGAQSATNRTEEATNFEISKTLRKHIREGGQIKRMSVAVLINDRVKEGPNGDRVYEARSAVELGNIEKLVKSAVGFDAERGDTIEIVNMRFADPPEMLGGLDDSLFLGFSTSDIRRLVEVLVLAVVGVLIILLVVRPLISKIFETAPNGYTPPAVAQDGQPLLPQPDGAPAVAGALPGPGGTLPATTAAAMPAAGDATDSLLDIAQVDGRVQASSLRKIGDIIEKHPEEAVSI